MSAGSHERPGVVWKAATATMITAGSLAGPGLGVAAADPASALAQAVVAARSAANCGALQYDSKLEEAADIVNRSTRDYVNHTTENVPIDEPHPTAIVTDVGYPATEVMSIKGASVEYGDTIRGLLIQGREAIVQCSYTDYGASLIRDGQSGYVFAVVILAGQR